MGFMAEFLPFCQLDFSRERLKFLPPSLFVNQGEIEVKYK
jgi:hypothetical protein